MCHQRVTPHLIIIIKLCESVTILPQTQTITTMTLRASDKLRQARWSGDILIIGSDLLMVTRGERRQRGFHGKFTKVTDSIVTANTLYRRRVGEYVPIPFNRGQHIFGASLHILFMCVIQVEAL